MERLEQLGSLRRVITAVLTALVTLAIYAIGQTKPADPPFLNRLPKTFQPYYLEFEQFITPPGKPPGTPISKFWVARRTDGTTASSDHMPMDEDHITIKPIEGGQIELLRNGKVKSTILPSRANDWRVIAAMPDPAQQCLATYSGSKFFGKKLLREEQYKSLRTFVIDEGNGSTYWRAPDLGCQMVRLHVPNYGKDPNKLINTTTQELVSAKLGEPPAELFDLTGLQEVTPSEFSRRYQLGHMAMEKTDPASATGKARLEKVTKASERLDKLYQTGRQKALVEGRPLPK